MVGRKATGSPVLRRNNDIESLVRYGKLAFLPEATKRCTGGNHARAQNPDSLFDAEAIAPA
jgi:hypothetical protein